MTFSQRVRFMMIWLLRMLAASAWSWYVLASANFDRMATNSQCDSSNAGVGQWVIPTMRMYLQSSVPLLPIVFVYSPLFRCVEFDDSDCFTFLILHGFKALLGLVCLGINCGCPFHWTTVVHIIVVQPGLILSVTIFMILPRVERTSPVADRSVSTVSSPASKRASIVLPCRDVRTRRIDVVSVHA